MALKGVAVMNIVYSIQQSLGSDSISKIAGMLGLSSSDTERAVSAAVPSLLMGIGETASTPEGARRLDAALNELDSSGIPSTPAQALSDGGGARAGSLAETGTKLLGSLFGAGGLSGLSGALGRFSGVGGGTITKLLGFLAPMILGMLKSRAGGGAGAIASLLAGQKQNITNAMPAGLGNLLQGALGMGKDTAAAAGERISSAFGTTADAGRRVGSEAYAATHAAASSASSSMRWALPVLALLILGALAWALLRGRGDTNVNLPAPQRPTAVVPAPNPPLGETARVAGEKMGVTADTVTTQIKDSFSSITSVFDQIRDSASAESAVPRIREATTKLEGIRTSAASLPAAARSSIGTTVRDFIEKLDPMVDRVMAIPGAADKIGPSIEALRGTLNELTRL
jgi:hypothetical protein